MPRVDILVPAGISPERTALASDALQSAMESALGSPPESRYHVFQEVAPDHLHKHPDAMPQGAEFFYLTFYLGPRPDEMIATLHREVLSELSDKADVPSESVTIIIVNVPSQNWWWHGRHS